MTNRSLGRWKLPQPTDLKEDNEWTPIQVMQGPIPSEYKISKDN